MATALSVAGLASNIDTKAIVDATINADRAPARLAEANKAKAQYRLDAIMAMNTKFLAIRDANSALTDSSTFAAKSATSSNETILNATASASAVAGSMTINVKALAAAHQIATVGQTSATTDLGSGQVILRLASTPVNESDLVLSPSENTLSGIAQAINAANKGVVASIVNDGSGASPYRLVITSTKTGLANAVTRLEGINGYAGVLPDLGSMTSVTAAADAEIRLGDKDTGLLLRSATNTVDQAIPGLTLNLKALGDGVNVSVNQNGASVRSSVQALADAMNSANDYYIQNSKYDVATTTAGALFSEYDLRSQLNDIESKLTQTFSSKPTGFQRLSDIGVTFDSTGKMVIDSTLFDEKLNLDQSAVASLFAAASNAANTPLDNLTRENSGTMALKQDDLKSAIAVYTARVTAVDERLVKRRAFYEAKFLAMEQTIARLQAQANSLSSITGVTSTDKSK